VQVVGLFLFVISLASGLTGLIAGVHKLRLALCGAAVRWRSFHYRWGAYRERLALAVPDFAVLKAAWQSKIIVSEDRSKAIEAELRAAAPADRKSRQAVYFASAGYDALSQCDYLRAHAAARLCLRADAKSAPGALALAIASAVFGQRAQVVRSLASAQKWTGLKGASTAWGWLGIAVVRRMGAGGSLPGASRQNTPPASDVVEPACSCQSRRGKLQSAILSARRACTPAPPNKEHAKLLIDLLLECVICAKRESGWPRGAARFPPTTISRSRPSACTFAARIPASDGMGRGLHRGGARAHAGPAGSDLRNGAARRASG